MTDQQAQSSPRPEENRAITVFAATEAYLEGCRNRGIQFPTLAKYRTLAKSAARKYCEHRGYVCLKQLSVVDMDRFYASWKDGIRSKAKKLERLKGFIQFAVKRKWLDENIAEDLRAPEESSVPADKMPFTDDELVRIYDACDELGGPFLQGLGIVNGPEKTSKTSSCCQSTPDCESAMPRHST